MVIPIPLLFAGIACLLPLAIYSLVLSAINARRHPTVVSGPWDFVGVLLATSGCWLVGGPCILAGLNARWRDAMLGNVPLEDPAGQSSYWMLLWLAYFVAVLGSASMLLWWRRGITVIYQIEPAALDRALDRVCDRFGLDATRQANHLWISPRSKAAPVAALSDAENSAGGRVPVMPNGYGTATAEDAEIELDVFPAMRNITLRWHMTPETLRRDVEVELAKVLNEVASPDNPASGWLLTLAGCLFLLLFGLLLLIFFLLFTRHW